MDQSTLIFILLAANFALWISIVLKRTMRFARYHQLEGYINHRYWLWLRRTKRELFFILLTLAGLSVLAILRRDVTNFALVGLIVGGILIVFLPSDKNIKQPFKPTARAKRLLRASLLLALILPVLGGILVATAIVAPDGAVFLLAINMVLAPLLLPLANMLLWPYEESQRRYFMNLAQKRLRDSAATVVVVTGSYGKTSTKHYLQHILSGRYQTLMTPKSFNTLMGISRAINEETRFQMGGRLDYYLAEADAYFVGENASICRLIEPQVALVMSCGPMHLERLGSMENVFKAQYEVVESVPPTGTAIFNLDDQAVAEMYARGYPTTCIGVSHKGAADARITANSIRMTAEGLHFTLHDSYTKETKEAFSPLYGETNLTNILMAVATASHLGMALEDIVPRLAGLHPADHRLVRRVLPNGIIVIDDAYSANPVGTKAALDVLALHQSSANRVVLSAGMFELGQESAVRNQALGAYMAEAATHVILIGGAHAAEIEAGLKEKSFAMERFYKTAALEEAVAIYQKILEPGDALLVLTDLPDIYA
jgi:UDP-N-acetylmuramoyl-tripeptide--D-alanyl-D-alanine ligase